LPYILNCQYLTVYVYAQNINIRHYTTPSYYGIFKTLFGNNFTISSLNMRFQKYEKKLETKVIVL